MRLMLKGMADEIVNTAGSRSFMPKRGLGGSQKRKQGALQRLQEAIGELSKEQRLRALEAIPERVKTALLSHMERGVRACKRAPGSGRPRAAAVHRKKGGWIAALTLVPHLKASTRCVKTQKQAVAMLGVLKRAQALAWRMVTDECHERESQGIVWALEEACRELPNSVEELSLSFCASVQTAWGRAAGSFSTSLDEALAQRALLLRSRRAAQGAQGARASEAACPESGADGRGLEAFRGAWLQVLQAPVRPRAGVFGRARPRPKALAEAQLVLEREVRRQAERRELSLRGRLQRAVRLVSDCLREEELRAARRKRQATKDYEAQLQEGRRKARQALRERKAERQTRWRWLKDPARTMEELLNFRNAVL
ncbi:unnamed protein product [Effrenium voratum]|uniref:Uncharacterized protein n=1 Tax=Effrenium voratum TaxID=2562239 RepID=A0AA36JG37_9DINO|nr:unnamed protein product [Effrenium voratum]CAJ1405029.1 unnamed protein product [Effrenium voratum]CAJ1451899.1 unnamed protein product [Effrenium voratum]